MTRRSRSLEVLAACRMGAAAALLLLAEGGCTIVHPRTAPTIPRSRIARCDHWQLDAAAALATPPDPVTGIDTGLGAYGFAMAQYRACLIGH